MSLSAIVIVKNEQKNIRECIKNLFFADEVIVIDNESADDTALIAESFRAKVYKIRGFDFSYLRNIGKEKAKSSWILYLDADERVSSALAKEIKEKLQNPQAANAFSVIRQNYYFGYLLPKTENMVRIIKKDALIGWHGSLHETPIVTGKIGHLVSPLYHYTHDNLTAMVEKTNEWSEIEAQLRYKNNHPKMVWWRFIRVMFRAFWKAYISDMGWRMGTVGLIESIYQSFSIFITYAKLWEKQNNQR